MIFIIIVSSLITFLLLIDIYHKYKPASKLKLIPSNYNLKSSNNGFEIECFLKIINFSKDKETMISNFNMELDLFDKNNLVDFNYQTTIIIYNTAREKEIRNYWPTIILKAREILKLKILIKANKNVFESNKSLWLKFQWENYGHFGIKQKRNYFLISNHKYYINKRMLVDINLNNSYKALAIKTSLLGAFDDPVKTICSYCEGITLANDILIIGETPLAIMQGRYKVPHELEYGFLSKILCYFFHPTSSLATACGMQLLINKVGVTRITLSLLVGMLFKLIRIKGVFYRLAGNQSSLIDDISGTTIPYDKTIVLGPNNAEMICKQISEILKINVAVVDVNDLGKVKILASTNKSINSILNKALKNNPAGNDDQKTPIVLIREKT